MLGAAILGAAATIGAGSAAASASPISFGIAAAVGATPPTPVVVVGAPGLRWDDVTPSATPVLWALLARSASGAASVKAADPVSCPDDGWLTLGAGNRATASEGKSCTAITVTANAEGHAVVAGFADLARHNRRGADATRLGGLADSLGRAGECLSAAGPGAAVGAADGSGDVASYQPDVMSAAADGAFLAHCPVTLLATTPATIDAVVARLVVTDPRALVLVVGVSETSRAAAHLHVAIAHGSGFAGGLLTSASTRRTGFVQLVDVAPTILSARSVAWPSSMIGQPWQARGAKGSARASVHKLGDLDRRARAQATAIVPFFLIETGFMLGACATALLARRRDIDPSRKGMWRIARIACAAAALVPASSFVAGFFPWWRSGLGVPSLLAATAVGVAVLTTAVLAIDALAGRPAFGLPAAIGSVTMAVIGIDLATGAHLQIFTMDGYSPLVAGRFAGIGNVAFGVFGAAAVLAAAGAYERFGPRGLGVVALVAVALDGAPAWGSDVGGVLALIPAFVVLGLLLRGARVSWAKAVATGGIALLAVAVLGAGDYSRPPGRQTHLGRFVGQLLHGGALTVVHRKAMADFDLLTHSALTLLVPVLVFAAVLVVARPPQALRLAFARLDVLRPTVIALLALAVVAAVVNDSGVAIPALMVLLVLPALLPVVLASDDGEQPGKLLP
jgi:hypothetical protein